MDTQLWDLFRETGDPLGYLLYKAEDKKKPEKKEPRETAVEDRSSLSL